MLSGILDVDATFVSLQKDPRPDDAAFLRERSDIIDFTAELTDFTETAALVSCLDLVITVDTSVAHLAGALGCPTWMLLPYTPDYRWLLDRDDSPWYPTVRLFRQTETRDYGRCSIGCGRIAQTDRRFIDDAPRIRLAGVRRQPRKGIEPAEQRHDRQQGRHRDGGGDQRFLHLVLAREDIHRLCRRHRAADHGGNRVERI